MQNPRDITFIVTNRGLVQVTLSRNIWSVSYSVPTETSGVVGLSRLSLEYDVRVQTSACSPTTVFWINSQHVDRVNPLAC